MLVANGLLNAHETRDRELDGAACLAALEAWAGGRGAQTLEQVTSVMGPGWRHTDQGPQLNLASPPKR